MSKIKRRMEVCLLALLSLVLIAASAFGQSSASLNGTILDASQAVLPAASVTAINVDTGVETKTTSNNSGIYNFPSLQPGTYNIMAQKDGFQTSTKTDVRLRLGSQSSLNFELAVAGTSTEVEVQGTVENMILDAGSSTGNVMQEELVGELPLVSNDVMELLNTMGGVVKAEDPIFSAYTQTFAGVSSGNINITRDGVSVNEVRYTSGITSPSRINQEMVGEFKMILSPVDAEMGRGAGQVQILTKSGGNIFHGSGVWNIQNTALDAREFEAKRIAESPSWRNLHNYTISVSGPIIKNKTFFFASWDQQLLRNKAWMTANALTPCARKGIYRYFGDAVGTNANDQTDYSTNPYPHRQAVVSNTDGTPLQADGQPGTTGLMYESVFGPLENPISDLINCSDYASPTATNPRAGIQGATAWDPNRNGFDQSGYIDNFLNLLPQANYYGTGDGLNTAALRWWRTTSGSNNIYGTGEDNRRKSITAKIDHNINTAHRLSGTYTWEKNIGEDGGPVWPENSYIGSNWRKPQSLTLSLNSTLASTVLNEFRFGFSRLTGYVMSSRDTSPELDGILNKLTEGVDMPDYNIEAPVVVAYDALGFSPGSNYTSGISHPYASRGVLNSTWGGTDNRWTFADTVTWMKGAHSFKGGFEMRLSKSWYTTDGEGGFMSTSSTYPMITGGDSFNNGLAAMGGWNFSYDATTNQTVPTGYWTGMNGSRFDQNSNQWGTVINMMNFLSGSVGDVRQYYYVVNDGGNLRWNTVTDGEHQYINDIRSREFSFFFKDDWKVTSDLTLNLGVRYEYYGVPWNETGMTAVLTGGSDNILGISGADPWMDWLGFKSDGSQSEYTFVGPNSTNSDRGAWNKDMNNFAPHVGFSWALPWWGRGRTTLRGGYSISYSPIGNHDAYKTIIGNVPGTSDRVTVGNGTTDPYVNLMNVGNYVNTNDPVNAPMALRTDRLATVNVYKDDIRTPYVQSLNLSLTRQISNNLTVDVRYIGTLARKQLSVTALNTPRYMDNGLFEEFEYARRNGHSGPNGETAMLDAIFPAQPPGPFNPDGADSVAQLMSAMNMATYATGSTMLANGNYSGLASLVSEAGTSLSGSRGLNLNGSGLPLNLIYLNPQFSAANITTNEGKTNYHSLQAQVTLRPMRGLSFQATYTWSRNLIDQGIGDYLTGERRYYLAAQHRSHTLNTYGSYELPFGANGFLFRNAEGAFKKAIEGWSLSWVASFSSGLPGSLTGANSLWNYSDAVVVDWDNWNNKSGETTYNWNADGTWEPASYFGGKYVKVDDPMCGELADNVISSVGSCPLKALALASDPQHLVIRNARPGEIGNLTPNSLTGPGRWNVDMTMAKSFEFMEGKRLELRVDAQNIFNHAMPSNSSFAWNARFTAISNPNFTLNNDNPIGYMSTKGGHRTFQAKIRISF